MWKRTAFRKGANLFLGRNQPVFGGLLPGFLCSKSVREIICFSGRMAGGIFRENQRTVCRFNFGVGIAPAKWHFQFRRRFCWLWSAGEPLAVGRQKTKKGGSRSFQNGFRLDYFQSLKISSNAISKAVFILFSINLKISASITDFYFFFLSLSFIFLLLILFSPHW